MVEENKHARKEGKRTKIATSHKTQDHDIERLGHEWKFQKKPAFLAERAAYFDQLFAAQVEKYAAMPQQEITITLKDGNQKKGTSFVTTPLDVAK